MIIIISLQTHGYTFIGLFILRKGWRKNFWTLIDPQILFIQKDILQQKHVFQS